MAIWYAQNKHDLKNSSLQHSSGWILFSNKVMIKNFRILDLTKDIYQNNQ